MKLDSFINNEFPALKLENAKFKSFLRNLNQVQTELTKLHSKSKLILTQKWEQ